MKKLREDWTVRTFLMSSKKGAVSFDYPIQRKGKQWGEFQRSLLIHSIVQDYPIPSLFSIVEKEPRLNSKNEPFELEVYYILDGKQRLTNIQEYVEGGYALHADTPSIIRDGEEIILAGKFFEELNDELKEKIQSCELQMYRLVDATEEEIEDVFFRLQNGTPLTKQQQGKAKMGSEWAERLTKLCSEHPVFKFNAQFTPLQIRKADDEMTILQTMMMLDSEYTLKSISSNDCFDYALTFKENSAQRLEVFNRVVEALDYIHEAFGEEKEKFLLKKVHMPMVLITALHAKDMGVEPIRFKDWTSEFEASYRGVGKNHIRTKYKDFAGEGSVKAKKAIGRKDEMIKHFNTYINIPQEVKQEEIKTVVEDLKKEIDAVTETTEPVETTETAEQVEVTVDEKKSDEVTVDLGETVEEVTVELEDAKEEVTIQLEDAEEVTVELEETKEEPVVTIELGDTKEEEVTVSIEDKVEVIVVTDNEPATKVKRGRRPKKNSTVNELL